MIRPPSNQNAYDLIASTDEAINAPPADADDATNDAFNAKLNVARDTGDWSGLLIEGKSPTKFVCRVIPQTIMRRIADRMNEEGPSKLGNLELVGLVLRLSVQEVTNLKDYKVRHESSQEWGRLASADLLDKLPPDVVNELGLVAWKRSQTRPL